MMKRAVSIIMVLALCIMCFSACTPDKPGTDQSSDTSQSVPSTNPPPTQPASTDEPSSEAPSQTQPNDVPAANQTGKKLAAITFDDGPGPYTKNLIEELNKRGVKATFFMLGQQAEKYGETIKFMYESGHQLGSHTYSHKDITKLTNEEFLAEMQRTDDAIKAATGQVATAFRPPYGAYNQEKLNLQDKTPTHWSVDTKDWENRNVDRVKNEIISHTKDGSIILLHDIYESSVQGALAAIDVLLADGFQFVTVNELVIRNGDPLTPHEIYFSCVPKK